MPVDEGNVGGGTGMIFHGVRGGTGTASRLIEIEGQSHTLGVLVQANYEIRDLMTPLFHGVAQATEEAILNATVAAADMIGVDDRTVPALCCAAVRAARPSVALT